MYSHIFCAFYIHPCLVLASYQQPLCYLHGYVTSFFEHGLSAQPLGLRTIEMNIYTLFVLRLWISKILMMLLRRPSLLLLLVEDFWEVNWPVHLATEVVSKDHNPAKYSSFC